MCIFSVACEHVIILEAQGKDLWKLYFTVHFGDHSSLFCNHWGYPTLEQAWAFHTRRKRRAGVLSLLCLFLFTESSNLPATNLLGLKIFTLFLSLALMLANLLFKLTLLYSYLILQEKCCPGMEGVMSRISSFSRITSDS